MNRNKIEKLASILKAHLDGKEIEFYSSTLNKWMTSGMNSIATLISNIDNYVSSQSQSTDHLRMQKNAGQKC